MKFLFIADDITIFGGAERVITNLANVMSKMQDEKGKNEIEIFSLHRINKHLPYHLDLNVKVSFYTQPATKNDIKQIKNFYKRFAIKFKVIFLKLKFFILHFRILKTDEILSRMLSAKISHCESDIVLDNTIFSYHPFYKNSNTKYIMLMHASYSEKATFLKRKYFNDLKDYDALVILSHAEFSIWQRYHNFVRVIPNFLPQIPSLNTTYSQKVVLSVGRLSKEKGFFRLLDIWKLVQDTINNPSLHESVPHCHSEQSAKHEAKNLKEIHKDNENSLDSSATLSHQNDKSLDSRNDDNLTQWQLIIVGDGVLKKELESKIKALNLQESVILKPFTKQIEKEYLNASIYAMSSHFEGFGMVLAEASSYALPCVAFDVKTGPSDIIENEKSGFLVADNDLQGYADKLMLLMCDENLRQNFGTKAKQLVSEKFGKEVVMKEWQGLFDGLCGG